MVSLSNQTTAVRAQELTTPHDLRNQSSSLHPIICPKVKTVKVCFGPQVSWAQTLICIHPYYYGTNEVTPFQKKPSTTKKSMVTLGWWLKNISWGGNIFFLILLDKFWWRQRTRLAPHVLWKWLKNQGRAISNIFLIQLSIYYPTTHSHSRASCSTKIKCSFLSGILLHA